MHAAIFNYVIFGSHNRAHNNTQPYHFLRMPFRLGIPSFIFVLHSSVTSHTDDVPTEALITNLDLTLHNVRREQLGPWDEPRNKHPVLS